MVKTDVCNDAAVGAGDDIGCIKPAAHADLEHDNVALSSAKPHKCHGGHHLKLRRVVVHCVGVRFHLRNELGDLLILNGLAVYLHTLVKAIYIRRSVKPHGETCFFENRCQHRRDAALAVCSGNMYCLETCVWMVEVLVQLVSVVQSFFICCCSDLLKHRYAVVKVFYCFFVIHDSFLFMMQNYCVHSVFPNKTSG